MELVQRVLRFSVTLPCKRNGIPTAIYPVSALLVVMSLVTLVFAGLNRASYSLAYTGMLGTFWVYKKKDSEKTKKWVAKFQLFSLAVVIFTTTYDIAGYVTVPWVLVVLCWIVCACLPLWDKVGGVEDADRKQMVALGLAVASFVIGVWQAIDSGLSE